MTQLKGIVNQMIKIGSITGREAMIDLSVQSLTSQIAKLRKIGFNIQGERKHHPITGQRYMRYHLKDKMTAKKLLSTI